MFYIIVRTDFEHEQAHSAVIGVLELASLVTVPCSVLVLTIIYNSFEQVVEYD